MQISFGESDTKDITDDHENSIDSRHIEILKQKLNNQIKIEVEITKKYHSLVEMF